MSQTARRSYDGVVVATPVTVPYVRYSTHGAHWFIGRAVAELVRQAGIGKDEIDGLCVSSFTLAPDTAVGLTQQIIWFGSAAVLGTYGAMMGKAMGAPGMQNVSMPTISLPLLFALIFFFLFGYVLYSSLFAAVGAMVGSQEEAQQAAQPVVLLLVASILLVQPIMFNPTGTLAVVMSIIPFTAPVIMPLRMSATQVPPLEIAASLAGVALACWGAIWVSARIYRVGLLMTGKRPSLKELMRWIRYA